MNQDNLGGIKERIILHRLLGASIAGFAVFLLTFALLPNLVLEASATQDVSAAVTWSTISLTMDPHGDIDFGEVIPSSKDTEVGNYGTQKVVKKAIDITTEGSYFAVYLSTVDNDNSLATSGDTVQNIPAIAPPAGSSSTSFTSTSWGYAIPTQATLATFSAYDSFLASASDISANNLTKTGTGSTVYNTGSWSAVPTLDNTAQIYSNSTNAVSGFSSGDSFNIYYSIMVDTDTMSGDYENEIVYTALASSSSLDEVSNNISRDNSEVTSATIETLVIDLASAPNSLTVNDVEVRIVPHSVITASDYDVSNLTNTDYAECSVQTVASQGLSATITCAMPTIGTTGSTDVLGDNTIDVYGEYDFWVAITLPTDETATYLSHYRSSNSDIASVAYNLVGLQTKNKSGNTVITTMQQMTSSICENTLAYDDDNTATFSLMDARDSISYNIRKIGDDNDCWMVQDLRFTGTELSTLTSDVDVNKTITYGDLTSGSSQDGAFIAQGTVSGIPVVYYNYPAITALTITSLNSADEDATYSLCPKNWQLPTAVHYSALLNHVDSFSPVAQGYYDKDGELSSYDIDGYWKTATKTNSDSLSRTYVSWSKSANYLSVRAYNSGDYLENGVAARCVARD